MPEKLIDTKYPLSMDCEMKQFISQNWTESSIRSFQKFINSDGHLKKADITKRHFLRFTD